MTPKRKADELEGSHEQDAAAEEQGRQKQVRPAWHALQLTETSTACASIWCKAAADSTQSLFGMCMCSLLTHSIQHVFGVTAVLPKQCYSLLMILDRSVFLMACSKPCASASFYCKLPLTGYTSSNRPGLLHQLQANSPGRSPLPLLLPPCWALHPHCLPHHHHQLAW